MRNVRLYTETSNLFLFSRVNFAALSEKKKQKGCAEGCSPLPLGERRIFDVDGACVINVKGTMALLLAQKQQAGRTMIYGKIYNALSGQRQSYSQ
ncbi:MAG: hypothetical protein J1F60_07165 [Oscillospiraceae bacterium]|nr:hypothetical protein [Oscillospiraceae bacterium]